MVERKWITGMCMLAVACMLVPTLASAQSITPVNRANMELAFDNVDGATGQISPTSDLDDNGVADRDEMGCFGELYASSMLDPDIAAAFDNNVSIIGGLSGISVVNAFIGGGVDMYAAYLATRVSDGDGDAADNLVALIDGFAGAAGGSGTNGMTFAALGFDSSLKAETQSAVFACLGISGVSVSIIGPTSVLLGQGSVSYTASTIDPDDPMFSETHTFSSSNPAILNVAADGTATPGASGGSAQVIATGDDTEAEGSLNVTVRWPLWFEICSLNDDFNVQGGGLAAAVGCALAGTNNFQSADFDLTGDGVRDAWQVQLVAYSVCSGQNGLPANGPDPVAAAASYAGNIAVIDQYLDDLGTIREYVIGDGGVTINITSPSGFLIDIDGAPMGETLQLGVTSTDAMDTTFTWDSTNGGVATVGMTTGLVTVTGTGTTVITAEGDSSGASDMRTLTVFDLATQTRVAASGGGSVCLDEGSVQLSATSTGQEGGEDHTWNVQSGTSVSVDANSGLVTLLTTGSSTVRATGAMSGVFVDVTVNVLGCTGPCDSPSKSEKATRTLSNGQLKRGQNLVALYFAGGGQAEAMSAGIAGGGTGLDFLIGTTNGILPVLEGMEALANGLGALSGAKAVTAALASLTLESELTVRAVLNGDGQGFPSGTNLDTLVNGGASIMWDLPVHTSIIGGIVANINGAEAVIDGMAFPGFFAANFPVLANMIRPEANAALADMAAFPASYTSLDFDVIGSPFKVAGIDPLDGGSVFAPGVNPSDLTNAEYHDLVTGAGGNSMDFVNLAAGINLAAAGSPFLPALGALAMGLLVGGFAYAGARRATRRRG